MSPRMDLRSAPAGDVPPPILLGDLRASERYCRDLTRREARNFYWGFIALPRDQRTAIYALYGFARQVDDDVDLCGGAHANGENGHVMHPQAFKAHRDRVADCLAGAAADPVMHVLAEIVPRYGILQEELEAIVRGVEMDTRVTRYETWADLQEYCRLVASAVGRMCVRIFGFSDPAALDYADDLGLAMQLANILRDVREDLEMGRIYLPQEDLRDHGISEDDLRAAMGRPGADGACGPAWDRLVAFEVQRAEYLFSSGLRVVQLVPRRAGVCVLTMAGIYQEILREIKRNPRLPLQQRASLTGRSKLAVMARSWLQAI
jgi:15-cis-phytoene synthase